MLKDAPLSQPEEKIDDVSIEPTQEAEAEGKGASERLPEPSLQPQPKSLTEEQKRKHYFQGLGVGFIPSIVTFFLGLLSIRPNDPFSVVGPFWVFIVLNVFVLIATVMLLIDKQRRFAGLGLLTSALGTPIMVILLGIVIRSIWP